MKQDLLRQPYAAELERRYFAFSVDLLRSSIFRGAVVPAVFGGSPKVHKPQTRTTQCTSKARNELASLWLEWLLGHVTPP